MTNLNESNAIKNNISLKMNSDIKSDMYIESMLTAIRQAQNDAEVKAIIDEIYTNGYEDGANSQADGE
jgi:hypothetical protein